MFQMQFEEFTFVSKSILYLLERGPGSLSFRATWLFRFRLYDRLIIDSRFGFFADDRFILSSRRRVNDGVRETARLFS